MGATATLVSTNGNMSIRTTYVTRYDHVVIVSEIPSNDGTPSGVHASIVSMEAARDHWRKLVALGATRHNADRVRIAWRGRWNGDDVYITTPGGCKTMQKSDYSKAADVARAA